MNTIQQSFKPELPVLYEFSATFRPLNHLCPDRFVTRHYGRIGTGQKRIDTTVFSEVIHQLDELVHQWPSRLGVPALQILLHALPHSLLSNLDAIQGFPELEYKIANPTYLPNTNL